MGAKIGLIVALLIDREGGIRGRVGVEERNGDLVNVKYLLRYQKKIWCYGIMNNE
jgi:hypothetical protein